MLDKKDMATAYHKRGFNCAQSVALPFAKDLGLEPDLITRAMEGFGGGMGGYDLTCGALSGVVFVASSAFSGGNHENGPKDKRATYALIKELVNKFRSMCGDDNCKVIRGIETKKPLLSCDGCIRNGVEILEELFEGKSI